MNRTGRTTESYFLDSKDVTLTQTELEKNKRIKTYFQKDDKIPNIDGYFDMLDNSGYSRKRYVVQIKGKDTFEYRKTKGKYAYSAEAGFFQYMLKGIESNPGFYFVAERTTGRVFYQYVSEAYLKHLKQRGLLDQGSFTILFGEDDILDEEKFYTLCEEIRNGRQPQFDPNSVIPNKIDFKSVRKLSDGLWVNWRTGRLDSDVPAVLLEEKSDVGKGGLSMPADRHMTKLSEASLRLLSVLVQGEGAVLCWDELYDRGIVMQEDVERLKQALSIVRRNTIREGGEDPVASERIDSRKGEASDTCMYPSEEEAERILEDALKTVEEDEHKCAELKRKVTEVIAAIRKLCDEAQGLARLVKPAGNGKGFRILLGETGIESMGRYFPEGIETDAGKEEWDNLAEKSSDGYCDTEGWLRLHYADVCGSFEGKISNAGGKIAKESRVFGNYRMAEAYMNAYAHTEQSDSPMPMLDFVEKWYCETCGQIYAQRFTHNDENDINRVLVLHGHPGDGKTTFCKKAVYAHCLEGWLADAPHVIRVSLNAEENKGILNKERELDLTKALGICRKGKKQFLFCAPDTLSEGTVIILDGYDELSGNLSGDKGASDFALFCDRVREYANVCNCFFVITSRTMCIKRELDERKKSLRDVTVASFAPLSAAQQDLMIERMIELDEEQNRKYGFGMTGDRAGGMLNLSEYKTTVLPKLRKQRELNKFLEIPILFRMIVTSRYRGTDSITNEAGLYGSLFHNLMNYRGRKEETEANLISEYEDIAARIFNFNNDICPFGNQDDENKELIYLFLTKNESSEEETETERPAVNYRNKAKGGRKKEGRLGFLHRSFRQYFLARYLVSAIHKVGAEDGGMEFIGLFRSLRARLIDEQEVWKYVYELVLIEGTEEDEFRDIESDAFLAMEDIKRVRACLDDEMAFAHCMGGDRNILPGSDAEGNRILAAENAVFNLVSALAAAEKALREKGEEADSYRGYANILRLLRRGFFENSARLYLEKADLSDCNLSRANFSGAYMADACLCGTRFRGADLSRADLSRADLRNAALTDADLSETILTSARLKGADLKEADLRSANLENASFDGQTDDEEKNRAGKSSGVEEIMDLYSAGKENATLKGANLSNAKMKGVHMRCVNLQGANLSYADLAGALIGVNPAAMELEKKELTEAAVMTGADFTGAVLIGADLAGVNMRDANLDKADLRKVNLIRADLTGASLMETYLDRAVLQDAVLADAHLERSHMAGAELSGAVLRNAHLEGAKLNAAYLDALMMSSSGKNEAGLSGCAELSGAHFTGTDLTGAYLSDGQYQYARERGAIGRRLELPYGRERLSAGENRDIIETDSRDRQLLIGSLGGINRIAFGRFRQGKNGEVLPLRWRVLQLDPVKNRVLLITEKLIDFRSYHDRIEDVTWAECSLREWLNGAFLREAFTEREQRRIAVTRNKNSDNARYHTKGGGETDDRVFLLSVDEAETFFHNDRDRTADATPYAMERYKQMIDYGRFGMIAAGWWWLRSPGHYSRLAAHVNYDGSVLEFGNYVAHIAVSVRPAFWLNL